MCLLGVKRELIHKDNNNYPTVCDLFEHYSGIIKALVHTSNPKNHSRFKKKERFVKGKTVQQGSSKSQIKSKQLLNHLHRQLKTSEPLLRLRMILLAIMQVANFLVIMMLITV